MQIFPEINGFELLQAHRVMDEPVLRDLFVFGEFGSPVGSRKRWKDTDDRLPFGYRQTGEGEPGDAADHDHQKDQRTTNEQPSGDGPEVTLRRARRLMQQQGGSYVTEPRPASKSRLADLHGVEPALDMAAPKLEKPAQLGEVRRGIEFLPDETLQQLGMIGKVIDDLRGRQPTFAKLWLQVAHVRALCGSPSAQRAWAET